MSLFRAILNSFLGNNPVPTSIPANGTTMESVRHDIRAGLDSPAMRCIREQKRLEEEARKQAAKKKADETADATCPADSSSSDTRASIRGPSGGRASVISTLSEDIQAAMLRRDPRSVSRQIVRWVNEKFDGDAVRFYTAAGISRSAYSKIISTVVKYPSKDTLLAMSAAFQLSLAEAKAFLAQSGYTLSDTVPADIVWAACLRHGVFHVPQIRELLAEYTH